MIRKQDLMMSVFVIALIVTTRVWPDLFVITPVLALFLFAGKSFSSRTLAYAVPLFTIFAVDAYQGFYPGAVANYCALALIIAIGSYVKFTATQWGVGAVISAVAFFVISNLGVWWTTGMYEMSFAGIKECYIFAAPFFRGTFLGTLLYSACFYVGGLILRSKNLQTLAASHGRQK